MISTLNGSYPMKPVSKGIAFAHFLRLAVGNDDLCYSMRRRLCATDSRRRHGWGCFPGIVEQILIPKLSADDVMIMDNLLTHKTEAVECAFAAAGKEASLSSSLSTGL